MRLLLILIFFAGATIWMSPYRDAARDTILAQRSDVQQFASRYSASTLNALSNLSDRARQKLMQLLREELHSTIDTNVR